MRTHLPSHVPPDHPIVTQDYAVFTSSIDSMVQEVGNWIESQKTGGYVWGYSRFGKTSGVEYFLHEMLKERFGNDVPLVIWSRIEYEVRYTPSQFWGELLRAGKSPYPRPRTSLSRHLELVMEMFISLARRAKGNFVVLLIDEAQGMRDADWQMLVGLQNRLIQERYRLCVISVGSHEMSYTHDALGLSGNAHVAARFLTENTHFRGVRSIEELEFPLLGYDEDSEWPVGSGQSYTASLVPDEFANGFRVTHSKEKIWDALLKCLPRDYEAAPEFPMQHIAFAVETVLLRIASGADPENLTTPKAWQTTVAETGLAAHMRLISALPRKRRSKGSD